MIEAALLSRPTPSRKPSPRPEKRSISTRLLRRGLGLACAFFFLSVVGATEAAAQTCGGNNQRYCCLWEGSACDSGHSGILATGPGSGQACTTGPFGISGSSAGTCYRDGVHPNFCGRTNQAPCAVTVQVALGIGACQPGLQQLLGTSGLRCRAIDSDGFPSHCGDDGEPPCIVSEHIPSCKSNYFESGGTCNAPDADGYPTFCGDEFESPCNVSLQAQLGITSCKGDLVESGGLCRDGDDLFPPQCGDEDERACTIIEHIPSCKSGLTEFLNTSGAFCRSIDGDGYPSHCGDTGEPACQLTEQIPSCKDPEAFELGAICTLPDADGYPAFCGDDGELACTLDLQIQLGITSCKPDLVENLATGFCADPDSLFPEDCGDPGERACLVTEHIPSCKSTAYEIASGALIGFTPGWCIDDEAFTAGPRSLPVNPSEAPPGPKSVFLIHGLGSGSSTWSKFDASHAIGGEEILTTYLVDYNSDGNSVEDGLIIRESDGTEICTVGTRLDGWTFSLPMVSRLLADALRDQANCRPAGFTEGPEDVAIVAHSMGGLVARDLVYRHFDGLLADDVRITDVITLGTPHRGGGGGIPEVIDGADSACLIAVADPRAHQICLMERWQAALQNARQDADALGAPFIDNLDFPEIRWTTIAAADSTAETPLDFLTFTDPITRHDGLVAHVSAFAIASDVCFPNVDGAPPPPVITSRGVPNIFAGQAWFEHDWPTSVVDAANLIGLTGAYDYNPWNGFDVGPTVQIQPLATTSTPNSLTSRCHSPGPSRDFPGRQYLVPSVDPLGAPAWATGDRYIGFPNTVDFDAPHGDLIGAEIDPPASPASSAHRGMTNFVKTVLTDGMRTPDVNRDGFVDADDYFLVRDQMNLPGQSPAAPSAYYLNYPVETDLDGDGFTTSLDLDVITALPEPGTGVGIALGGLALALLRRGRRAE